MLSIAQSYLSAEDQVFLRDVNDTLVKFNKPMASGISDFDKIEYAQKLDEERSF